MQQFLLMMVAVVLVEQSVVANDKLIADPIVEKAIRLQYKKPEGNITKADLENVYELNLGDTQITDAGLKDVAKLQNLEELVLENTQITDEGLKRWPSCRISKSFIWQTPKSPTRPQGGHQITESGVADLDGDPNHRHRPQGSS